MAEIDGIPLKDGDWLLMKESWPIYRKWWQFWRPRVVGYTHGYSKYTVGDPT